MKHVPDFQDMNSPIDFSLQYKTRNYHNDYEAFLSPKPSVIHHLVRPTVFYHISSFFLEKKKKKKKADLLPVIIARL